MTRTEAMKIRELIEKAAAALEDSDGADAPMLFPRWKAGAQYAAGDRVYHDGALYKCVLAHVSQTNWEPQTAHSLFSRVAKPNEEYPEWIKPTGAHDAYGMGDKVSYEGKRYVSELYANVYEPGVYGWKEVRDG